MSGVKQIHAKMISIQNTQKITKTMEMVAISKMRKAQERMVMGRPYVEKIRQVIGHITLGNLEYKHSYLDKRETKCVGYIVVSTDRGLAGNLNINLFKNLIVDMQSWDERGVRVKLALIGSKAVSFFHDFKNQVITQVTGMGENPTLSELIGPIKVMLHEYDERHLDKLYMISNKFINTLSQVPKILQILPLLPYDLLINNNKDDLKSRTWDYLYEPDPKPLLDILLRRYVESQVYQGVIENLASEQAARWIAMKAATDNSRNLIKELQFIYNKTRQNSITQEVIEIVSGSSVI